MLLVLHKKRLLTQRIRPAEHRVVLRPPLVLMEDLQDLLRPFGMYIYA